MARISNDRETGTSLDLDPFVQTLFDLAPALLDATEVALIDTTKEQKVVLGRPESWTAFLNRCVEPATGKEGDVTIVVPDPAGSFSGRKPVVLIPIVQRDGDMSYALLAKFGKTVPSNKVMCRAAQIVSTTLGEALRTAARIRELEADRFALIEAIKLGNDTLVIYDEDDCVLFAIEGRSKYQNTDRIFPRGKHIVDAHKRIVAEVLKLPEAAHSAWVEERTRYSPECPYEVERTTETGRGLVKDGYSPTGARVTSFLDLTAVLGKTELYQETLRQVEANAAALREAHAELQLQASTDALTGLNNRRSLENELKRLTDPNGATGAFALLHLDLDGFKAINDTLGHQAGDDVLCHVADTLRGMVQPDDFVSRVGGDEFILISADVDTAAEKAKRFIEALSEPIEVMGELCTFGASVGIAVWDPDAPIHRDRLLGDADIALYHAKDQGRGRFATVTDNLRAAVRHRKSMTVALHLALQNNEFFVVYQPQFDTATDTLVGVEALIRWNHPELGILAPPSFLDLAHRLRIISDIDRTVLRQVAEDDTTWRQSGLHVPSLSVNIASERLRDPTLVDEVGRIPHLHHRLNFEVLESVFSDQLDEGIQDVLHGLAEFGVRIDVDDFGMGHSSLMGLLALRPERLKISRDFVAQLPNSARHADVVKFIVDIANSLGIEVIAEGVETLAQRQFLAEAGCQVLQGYYFARPMTAKDLLFYTQTLSPSKSLG